MKRLEVGWLGRVDYRPGLALQEALVDARRAGRIDDALVLLEHPPVVTLGRNGDRAHLLSSETELAEEGIELHECGRGGDVTYHGPGQLVGYPVLALEGSERDAHAYLRRLEQGLIDAAAGWGLEAARVPGLTGIWVGDDKLAAIGVRLSTGWITSHGFAFNVSTDLAGFDRIVPCGIRDRGVTSLQRLLGAAPPLEEAARRISAALARALDRAPTSPSASPRWIDCLTKGAA